MLKRTFDILAATAGLILLSPILLAVSALILWKMGWPVLFRQTRPGKNAVPFKMVKFRTMSDELNKDGTPRPDNERLTPLGQKLRSTSLDELPELWNVLKGDMSVVGPRPLLMRYVDRYSPYQSQRMNVRPGITGWAQINGRNAISWEQRFDMDVWYVDNQSFLLDMNIVCKTFGKVLRRADITEKGSATMSEFTGSSSLKSDCHNNLISKGNSNAEH